MVDKIIKFITNPETRFGYLSKMGFYNKMSDEDFLKKEFYLKTGKELDLNNPKTFNEKMQWLKLHDRKSIYSTMVDKCEAKKYVADIIGEKYIIPTIGVYDTFDEINFDELPEQFVIKCTHDSGGIVICRDKSKFNKKIARKKIEKYLKRKYYYVHREWPYKNVRPRIIVEKYMEDKNNRSMRDYKFFCFGGEPKILYLSEGLENHSTARMSFYDMSMELIDCRRKDFAPLNYRPVPPKNFEKMKKLSAKLSRDIPHVRVDWYEIDGRLYFGELTFTTCAGMVPFADGGGWDEKMGSWVDLEMVNKENKKNKKNRLISIISPTYNSLQKVNRLIESISRQSYKRYEVIFVDDGSTDGTYEYLKGISAKNSQIQVFRKEHAGPGLARKFGYEKSRGELLFFVDSDDWLYADDSLAKINELFLKNDIDICIAPRKIFPSGKISTSLVGEPIKFGVYNLDILKKEQVCGGMGAKIFKRDKLRSEMFIGAYSLEDAFVTYNYLAVCDNIMYTDQFFQVINRSRDNRSLTRTEEYNLKTFPERARGLIAVSKGGLPEPVFVNMADVVFDVYCGYLKNGLGKQDSDTMRELEKIICRADLSGFRHNYSLKKRAVLWWLKHKPRVGK